MHYEHYLPVVLAALTVLILGCWNPKALQVRDSQGNPTGSPSYLWLALFALLVGALTVFLIRNKEMKSAFKLDL